MLDVALTAAVGISQGLRHALEPDHVTALATVVVGPGEKKTTRATVRYAAAWGFGHGLVLVGLGGILIALGAVLPPRVADALELVVAAVLVGLGVRAIAALRGSASVSASESAPLAASALRPFPPLLLGCIHGLAGTGAVVATALAVRAPSRWVSVGGVALYASGAAIGMMLLAGIAGPALSRAAQRPAVVRGIGLVAGAASVLLGVFWGVRAVLALT